MITEDDQIEVEADLFGSEGEIFLNLRRKKI